MSTVTSFKKLNTKIYQKVGAELTPDNIYWKKLGAPVLVKEFGPIDYVDFSPIAPYHFAVTCSVRVQVYNPITKLVVKNLSRFRENAYGAVFRNDGRLLCAGGEETNVKLFDVPSKTLLRLFKGHTAPVHRVFFINDKPQIVSFSDDKSVKVWDVPTEQNIVTYTEHNDYIRSGATNPVVSDIFLSGGYDNLVKMYDARTQQAVMSVDHGSPVESLIFLPSGSIFLSAGGTEIKIWDTIAGGKLLGSLSHHHKTITCLRLASDNKRLLSGSLDRHVKIYDVGTYKVVHTLDYPNSVLSLGVSKNDDTVVAGLVNGLVSISRREEMQEKEKEIKKEKKLSSFKYIPTVIPASVDNVIAESKIEKQSRYDHHLRKFEFSKALDCVLAPYVANKNPQITVSVMQELIRRRALSKAFQGRDHKSVIQIIRFLIKNITDYRFTRILIDAGNILLDTYEDSIGVMPSEVVQYFMQLLQLVKTELEQLNDCASLQGALHMLLSAASTASEVVISEDEVVQTLIPSKDAQKNLIVNLT